MTVLPFPSEEDRETIRSLLRSRANGEIGEAEFSRQVVAVLRHYGISQLCCGSFRIRDCGDFHTPRGPFPVVAISAAGGESKDGRCPACGHGPGRWLRGDRTITAFCVACGCVYTWPVADEFGL